MPFRDALICLLASTATACCYERVGARHTSTVDQSDGIHYKFCSQVYGDVYQIL